MSVSWSRPSVLFLAVPFLLTACSGVTSSQKELKDPGPTCQTEGTVGIQPAPSIEEAVSSFRQDGEEVHVRRRVQDTAVVQLRTPQGHEVQAVVRLVHTKKGWAPTSVARC